MRLYYLAGWGYVVIASAMLYRATHQRPIPVEVPVPTVVTTRPVQAPVTPMTSWWERVRPHCNPVEVEVTMAADAPPSNFEGQAYAAACYALAGKITRAAERIDALNESERQEAANIVFNVAHPVADAGDDEAAGPIMQLVVEYLPAHYMALYHAGIAQYRTKEWDSARRNLNEFLIHYKTDDGWTNSAKEALRAIGKDE